MQLPIRVQTSADFFRRVSLKNLLTFFIGVTVLSALAAVAPYICLALVILMLICCVIAKMPRVGLLFLIYSVPIEKIYYYKLFTIKPVIIFTVLVFSILVMRGLLLKDLRLNKSIVVFFSLFLVSIALSSFNAVKLSLCIRLAFLYLIGFMAIYVVYSFIDSNDKLRFVLKHFFIATFICVSYGYLQYFLYVILGFNLDKYIFPDRLQVHSILPEIKKGLYIVSKWSDISGRIGIRANSCFTDPNIFAIYINSYLAIILTSTLYFLRKGNIRRFLRKFVLFSFFCGAVFLSISRTGISELFFMMILAMFLYSRKVNAARKLFFVLLLGGVAYLCLNLFHNWFNFIFMDRLNNLLSISSGHERVVAARAAFDMFSSHPFVGIGAYNYGQIYGRFYDPGYLTMSPHNTYLAVLSETGLCGTMVFLSFLYILYNAIKKYIKRAKDYDKEVIGYGLLVGFLGLIFSFAFYQTYMLPMIWVYYGIIFSLKRIRFEYAS